MNPSILNNRKRAIKHRSTFNISYDLMSYILIAILIAISYYPAIDNHFLHWDDQYYVTENIYINQPTLDHFKVLLTKVISLNYHPATMISLWFNSYFFGVASATPFIVTNIILHCLTSFLVYKVFDKLFDGKHILALTTSLLFAIHPMHVESVVWVSERKDVLYAFFFLASLWTWLKYRAKKQTSFFILAFGLFVLSCLSKAMAVSMVPILFLIDLYQGNRWWKASELLKKLPFLLFALLVGMVAIDVQSSGDFHGLLSNTNIDNAINTVHGVTIKDKLISAGYGLYFYIKSFFLPTQLNAFHPYPAATSSSLSPLFLLVPFLIFGVWSVIRIYSKTVFFGLGFFILTVALVLQWIPVGSAIVADRYTYLPYVGLSIIIGCLMQYIHDNKSKTLAHIMLSCIIIPLIIITNIQSQVWQNHTSLFSQAIEQYPEDPTSRLILATGQWNVGQYREAIENLEYAVYELGLHTSDAFEKLANCYEEIGEKQKAISFYNYSIELDPQNYVARYHRGVSIMNIDPQKAIDDFTVAESSGFEYIQNNIYGPRGLCYGMIGNYNQAIKDLSIAIDIGQDLKVNYRDRAITYEKMGMTKEAQQDWLKYSSFE